MDWKRIISELRAAGLTQEKIAEACGCDQTTISRLLCGRNKEPRGSLALSLLRMHGIHCSRPQ